MKSPSVNKWSKLLCDWDGMLVIEWWAAMNWTDHSYDKWSISILILTYYNWEKKTLLPGETQYTPKWNNVYLAKTAEFILTADLSIKMLFCVFISDFAP